jgi:hypothetical protein
MTHPSPGQATQLLIDWSGGDSAALRKLTALIYDELHRLAHRFLRRERGGHTLQTPSAAAERPTSRSTRPPSCRKSGRRT